MGDDEVFDFAAEFGSPACTVKLGCSGPLARCHLPAHGRMDGIGGCPNVGGICIGCTTPGFPDTLKRPTEGSPRGARATAVLTDGRMVRALRNFTRSS